MTDFLVAVGLVLVIEGAIYAIAPDRMKGMMRQMLELPDQTLRTVGVIAAVTGVGMVWMIRG
jgi:hypothetical protein